MSIRYDETYHAISDDNVRRDGLRRERKMFVVAGERVYAAVQTSVSERVDFADTE